MEVIILEELNNLREKKLLDKPESKTFLFHGDMQVAAECVKGKELQNKNCMAYLFNLITHTSEGCNIRIYKYMLSQRHLHRYNIVVSFNVYFPKTA